MSEVRFSLNRLEHSVSEYKPQTLNCINCKRATKDSDTRHNTNHAAWDNRCPVYEIAVDQFKKEIFPTAIAIT